MKKTIKVGDKITYRTLDAFGCLIAQEGTVTNINGSEIELNGEFSIHSWSVIA